MNRFMVIVGMLASGGAAYATAGWDSPPVAHTPQNGNRGRIEFVHAAPALDGVGPAAAGTTDPVGTPPPPDTPEPGPATVDPEPPPAPELPPLEPLEISDVRLCPSDQATDRPRGKIVRLHLDIEGIIYWYSTAKGLNEVDSHSLLGRKLGAIYDSNLNLVIVPDRETLWQAVKKTLDTAKKRAVPNVYLGVATTDEPNVLKTLPLNPAGFDAPEGDLFVIKVKEGDALPEVVANGTKVESWPTDLALAWSAWKRDHKDANTSGPETTPVILDVHRFTPMEQVVPVIDVLRGLGIEYERHEGEMFVRERRGG